MRRSTGLAAALLLAFAATIGSANAAGMLNGAVKSPLTLDQATLGALPATTEDVSFETSNGKESGTYTGVLLWDLVNTAELVNDDGKNSSLKHTLLITGSDGYAVAVAVGEFDPKFGAKQVLLAYQSADGSVSYDHLRVLVPGDIHGGRAVKDVASIEVK
jgi:hypothetical protein